ncbi:junction-mediating and -regulatory protein [Xenopus tropicalis]|uniref:Junction-mediating and -regulatory protein n=1 Tax=Xenopus tropicalis TaxID=8364 RepID=JMY_XENTR|nr:junction-mediating and -regulatory protein [Xenopus tropicalis]A8E4X8.1 RecName: Full=Junction-mediating and -regulatory protein [Xenopus tropicalis]AAI53371.1 jmy protein [Xenopus tropicalis]|eukprot:NP_001106426.1 junction-mediating and -regulatory protein [Xenopus tropicalis]
MSFNLEDTLESDWVAVRPNVFEEKERRKFVFIVAWNEVEGKFAITCHNRTAQRQRSADKAGGRSPARQQQRDSPAQSPARKAREEPEEGEEEECSWAGLFSFQDLRAVHQQLCSVSSELEPCLPTFPEEPSGVWSVLFGPSELSEAEVEDLGRQLRLYLGHALDTSGWKILSQVLFADSDDPEEYYQSLSELRHKGYEEGLQRARKRLQELLEKHKTTEVMVDLLDLYQLEDEAYSNVVEATTELYQYLLQPFRDMRELAMLRRQQIKISIENDYLGPRRIESLKKEDADWQKKAHMAVLSIQDLTVKYFEITARAQKAVFDRMRGDQKKFGKTAWAAAVERVEKLQYGVAKETLQLMRAKEICLEQKKHALKDQMQSLQGGTEAIAVLDELEADYYDHQLQLYEVQFEILKCEELLLTAQLESIKRQISEKTDEVVYYDTYESMEAMLATEDMAASIHIQRVELQKLQQKVRQLEAKRGRISAKKAYLRNKKEICIAKHSEKIQQRLHSDEGYRAAQLKQEKQEDEEERKSTWVSQERQKTLDRLRTFKQRHPGQVVLKSTRLRFSHERRRSTIRTTSSTDAPQSLSVSIQTQGLSDLGDTEVLQPIKTQKPETTTQLEDSSLPPNAITSELPLMTSLPTFTHEKLEPEISTLQPSSLPASPPPPPPPLPPPPPPPLPPSKQDTDTLEIRVIHVKKETEEKDGAKPVSGPLAQLFDSSQLLNARKTLKKTGALEGIQRRRVSSPMDEVLASLKRGSFHLKKVEQRALPPFPDEDESNNILAQIRKGVKLKKVQKEALRESFTLLPDTDPLTRSIHEALRRIKEASPESEDEEESLPCTDWEN